jgi:hypothetical protein
VAFRSPLPVGERSDVERSENIRVRGLGSIERPAPPHLSPLPNG